EILFVTKTPKKFGAPLTWLKILDYSEVHPKAVYAQFLINYGLFMLDTSQDEELQIYSIKDSGFLAIPIFTDSGHPLGIFLNILEDDGSFIEPPTNQFNFIKNNLSTNLSKFIYIDFMNNFLKNLIIRDK